MGYWLKYMYTLAGAMGLGHYEWELYDTPVKSGAAEITFKGYQRVGKVMLCADFDDQSPEFQRDTLVHEIMHGYFLEMDQVLEDQLHRRPWWAPKKAWAYLRQQVYDAHQAAEEYLVSDVTRAWSKTLPLPPKVPHG